MFTGSYKIATVMGIPIKVHISLLLMVLFLSADFGFFYGLLLTFGLVISISLHELGHSAVALRKGCRVREITLMCIGGAAHMERIPTRPRDEFLMALAGPAVSLVLGIAGVYGGAHLGLPPIRSFGLNIVQVVGVINLALVIFNLLPSFPMDGGRVFRALLTPKLGRLKATHVAARLGQIMAIVFGFYAFFSEPRRWFLIAIAFFIYIAAGNEYRMVEMEETARGRYRPWEPPEPEDDFEVPPDDDSVIISPPPYKKRRSRTRIQHEDQNPFRGLFGE